jgi:hypothetical protein
MVLDSGSRPPRPHLEVSSLSLQNITPGDTVCDYIILHNPDSTDVKVTNVSLQGSNWSVQTPALPFTIPGNGTRTIPVCFSSPMYNGYGSMMVTFTITGLGVTNTGTGYLYGSTIPCLETSIDTVRFNDVIVGGYVDAAVTFTNHSSTTTMSEHHLNMFSKGFSILNDPFPTTVQTGSSITVHYRFAPDTARWHYGYTTLLTDSLCQHTLTLLGQGIPGTDSSEVNLKLFPETQELLPLRTETNSFTRTFYFRNNANKTARVTDVYLAHNDAHFSITGMTPNSTPVTLTTGQTMGVEITFTSDTNGFYHDSLVVITEDGAKATYFDLEAVRTNGAAAAVGPQVKLGESASLSLSPNPMSNMVDIHVDGVQQQRVEIYDMLGNRIAEVKGTTWSSAGLANGSYIVRASGIDGTGKSFVISKRLVVQQ